MNVKPNRLSVAVRLAFSAGIVASASVAGAALAQSSNAPAAVDAQTPKTLQTIVVTGSHIRRVDIETANPVVVVTAQAIQQTGRLTLGQVVQDLPVVTGGVSSPHVDGGSPNNGGGTGQSLVGLRGLGASRTLVLVDGQRVLNKDLSSMPASAVERIEVLTNGASSVYGSDAIGGVINIILKSNYQGAQFQANYGISDYNDGERQGFTFTFGQTSDKGSILAGIDYNQFDEVMGAARKFGENVVSITGSTHTPPFSYIGGSTYAERDFIQLPASLAAHYGCNTVSLNASAVGNSPTSLGDYHCYNDTKDAFDYGTFNVLQLPQERTNAFIKGIYHLTDNVDAYMTVYHNKTHASVLGAPTVFGTPTGGSISQYSYYNPFGIDFTPANGNGFRVRLVPAGDRIIATGTTTNQVMFGLRGHATVFGEDWTWDVGYNYGHMSNITTSYGFPNEDTLNADLGPSMLINGVVQCVGTPGDPTTVIAGCTPFDPFNINSPSAKAVLSGLAQPPLQDTYQLEKTKHVDISGGIFDLPAGTIQLAAGLAWRDEYIDTVVDPVLIMNPDTGTCILGSACAASLQGGYTVKEAYAELFVPILSHLPLAYSLNLDLGDRYSDYSTFGSTNNWKIGVEYRPIEDLLLRGTVSQVFRAPTIGNVFESPTTSAPLLSSDPCDGITAANPACVGVPLDGTFVNVDVKNHQQIGAYTSGSQFANFPLGPETGKSFDFGAVYSPHFLPGFSASVDIWRIYLNNVITGIGAQEVLNLCYVGDLIYCPLITRFVGGTQPGQIIRILQPTVNLGRIDVKGTDFSAQYKLPDFSFGQFTLALNATYMSKFDIQTAPGTAYNQVLHAAGMMGSYGSPLQSSCPFPEGYLCFFPRVRAQASIGWQLGPWEADWRLRYSSPFKLGSPDPSQGDSAIPGFAPDNPYVFHFGSSTYSDVTVGYNIAPLNTRLDVGVDNVFDKQPPFLYGNNAQNDNTDGADFDVMGRYYWGRVTVKF
ncbi:MAG: TonB-dependent receptor plug domain-containing protein [Rhodanobacteraceae bacterium]